MGTTSDMKSISAITTAGSISAEQLSISVLLMLHRYSRIVHRGSGDLQ